MVVSVKPRVTPPGISGVPGVGGQTRLGQALRARSSPGCLRLGRLPGLVLRIQAATPPDLSGIRDRNHQLVQVRRGAPLPPACLGIPPRGHTPHRLSDQERRWCPWPQGRSRQEFGHDREERQALPAGAAISVCPSPSRDLTRSLRVGVGISRDGPCVQEPRYSQCLRATDAAVSGRSPAGALSKRSSGRAIG